MPAAPDSRLSHPHLPHRTTRFVLLVALGAGLAGLALPGSPVLAVSAARAVSSAGATGPAPVVLSGPPERREPSPAQLLAPRAPAARANRSRSLATLWVRPVDAVLVSPYGRRAGGWHPGVDFAAPYGAPIHAVGPGVVLGAGYLAEEGGYGQIILIQHPGGVVTAYAHASRTLVHAGDHVQAGELIGRVGATGEATGPHLHFEVRINGVKVDPVPWLRAHGVLV